MTRKIDIEAAPHVKGSGYPMPYDEPCAPRQRWRLGDAAGLTQFGVNLMRLPPGAWSSQRHWHSREDEFVYILEGEVVMVTDDGETVLKAGDCVGFKAGDPDGHHMQNRSASEVVMLEIGTRNPGGAVDYPDSDMTIPEGVGRILHRDGRPYAPEEFRKR